MDSLMRPTRLRTAGMALTGLLCLAFSAASAQTDTDPPPAIDPQAIEIVENAAAFLAAQEAVGFNWFVSYDQVVDGREKLTELRSGRNLLARGTGFYAYSEHGMDTREYFYDGTNFQIYDVEENAYVLAPFSGSFEGLVDRLKQEYDVVLPIWSILANTAGVELADSAESAAYLGRTRVAGRVAHHVALASYDEDWQLWILDDPEKPEILMLVGTDPYKQGWPQYRAYFSDWDFAPEIAEGAFDFLPPEDAERMSWPKTGPRNSGTN